MTNPTPENAADAGESGVERKSPELRTITFTADTAQMFNMIAATGGDFNTVGGRLASCLLGGAGWMEAVGLAAYGIEIGEESLSPPGPMPDNDRPTPANHRGAGEGEVAGFVKDDQGVSDAEVCAVLLDGYARDKEREKLPRTAQALRRSAELLRAAETALAHPPAASPAGEGQAIPADIAAKVLEIGRAEWGSTPEHDADGHADHIRESVHITAQHFGQIGPQQMHGLYIEGTGVVICHTGTSPNSAQIARALTGAWNWLHDQSAYSAKRHPVD